MHHLYAEWLPQSGEELRDFPLYFQRVKFFPDVAEHEVTDVFLPLKAIDAIRRLRILLALSNWPRGAMATREKMKSNADTHG